MDKNITIKGLDDFNEVEVGTFLYSPPNAERDTIPPIASFNFFFFLMVVFSYINYKYIII